MQNSLEELGVRMLISVAQKFYHQEQNYQYLQPESIIAMSNSFGLIDSSTINERPDFVDLLLRSGEYEGEDFQLKKGGQSQLVFLTHKDYGAVVVKVMDSSAILRSIEGSMDPAKLQELKIKGAKWTAREVANALVVQGHPNIIVVKEAAYIGPEHHQHKYFTITMEQANGDLSEVIRGNYRNGLLSADTLDIFQQLAYAVHHLHSEGVMHRDIKSSNCLLFRINDPQIKLVVKLSDFGLSKSRNDSACLTKSGTWPYAAPELLFQSGPYDGYKLDVWSLGVVLYEMIHGHCPFGSECREIQANIQKPVQFTKEDMDPLAKDLILKMLQHDPKTRCDMVGVINHPFVSKFFHNSTAYKLDKFHKFVDPRALKFQNPEDRKQLMHEVMERFQSHLAELQLEHQQVEQQQVPSVQLVSALQNKWLDRTYSAERLVYEQMQASELESDPQVTAFLDGTVLDADWDDLMQQIDHNTIV
eukprot:TRINITY_DN2261_c0_g1_i3.p1 TRINITY_DN2261_c0_g1~~TRINITY_DN2261_c0_g1_i3.p1  ORF type:complete len:474 (-),score=48.73 TRINITY_DN2261_c0_g1_i3:309-1730(-)